MAKNFHEHFEAEPPPLPSPRSTGLVFAVVALIVAVLWRADPNVALPACAIGALFALTAWLAPAMLGPLNIVWFRFALLLNRVVSPVVMAVLYWLLIVPAGLIMQRRYDPLVRRKPKTATTYWIERPLATRPSDMRNQF